MQSGMRRLSERRGGLSLFRVRERFALFGETFRVGVMEESRSVVLDASNGVVRGCPWSSTPVKSATVRSAPSIRPWQCASKRTACSYLASPSELGFALLELTDNPAELVEGGFEGEVGVGSGAMRSSG